MMAARKKGTAARKKTTGRKTSTKKTPTKKATAKKKAAPKKGEPKKKAPAKKAGTARKGAQSKGAQKTEGESKAAPKTTARKAPSVRKPPAGKGTRARGAPKRSSVVIASLGSPAASKLGTKWNCFACGAKFYDLNKPEPLCPRCGTDQRERPKESNAPTPPQPRPAKRAIRPMAPLLDDDDDAVRYEEEFDLGLQRSDPDDGPRSAVGASNELFPGVDLDEGEEIDED